VNGGGGLGQEDDMMDEMVTDEREREGQGTSLFFRAGHIL
jgi:hypothetical protein